MKTTTLIMLAACACLAACLSACGGPEILKAEPPGGAIPPGESVLVDDGRCPAGQVSRVTGPKTLTASRTYACTPRR